MHSLLIPDCIFNHMNIIFILNLRISPNSSTNWFVYLDCILSSSIWCVKRRSSMRKSFKLFIVYIRLYL